MFDILMTLKNVWNIIASVDYHRKNDKDIDLFAKYINSYSLLIIIDFS